MLTSLPTPHRLDLEDNEESYVPLWLVHDKLGEVLSEMEGMRNEHVQVIEKIKRNYEQVMQQKQHDYEHLIDSVRAKARSKLEEKDAVLAQLKHDDDAKQRVEEFMRVQKLSRQLQQRLDDNEKKMMENERVIESLREQVNYHQSESWKNVVDNVVSMVGVGGVGGSETPPDVVEVSSTKDTARIEDLQSENERLVNENRKVTELLRRFESAGTDENEESVEQVRITQLLKELEEEKDKRTQLEEQIRTNDEKASKEVEELRAHADASSKRISELEAQLAAQQRQQQQPQHTNDHQRIEEAVEAAKSAVAQIEEKCAEKKNELNEANESLKTLRNTLRARKPELKELASKRKAMLSQYKSESETLKEQLVELGFFTEERGKPTKNDLEGDTLEFYVRVGNLKRDSAEIDSQYKREKTEYEDMHSREKEQRQVVTTLQGEYQALLDEEQTAKENLDNTQKESGAATPPTDTPVINDGQVKQLQEQLDRVTEKHKVEMDALAAEANTLRVQLQQLLSASSEGNGDAKDKSLQLLESANSQLAKLAAEKSALEKQAEALKEQLLEAQQAPSDSPKADDNDERLQQLKSKLSRYEKLNESSQKDLLDLQKQLNDAKREMKSLKVAGDPVTLKKKLAAQEKEMKRINDQAEKARADLEKSSGQIEKQLKSQFKSEMNMKEKEFQQKLTAIEKDLNKQLKKSQAHADKFKENYEQAANELSELQAQHKELTKMHTAMSTEMDTMKSELQSGMEAMEKVKAMTEATKRMEMELTSAQDALRDEQIIRKKLRNELEDLKGKIRVYCRCRPMNSRERELDMGECVRFPDPFTILLTRQGTTNLKGESVLDEKQYEFDQVFAPGINGSQEDVFEATSGLAQSACDGFNVCIFAYGQTGSGKTYTMAGEPDNEGLKPRFIKEIFAMARKDSRNYDYTISCTLVEIYLDKLRDLFWLYENRDNKKAKMPDLKIGQDRLGIVQVKNAIVRSFEDGIEMLDYTNLAESVRKVGSTKMNAGSSRSHLIFAMHIQRKDKTSGKQYFGKLSLVDLAGSESVGKTGATKDRLREAQSINTSLSALAKVIRMLAVPADKRPGHIPYRDNMLTRIMEDSLGGNAKTLMFVNISPSLSEFQESNSSLSYASIVKTITNDASAAAESKEILRLKNIIKALKAGNAANDDDATTVDEMSSGA